ncbi:MAG: hypothetical protein KA715_08375 [Xanthomonadaceae bacterium]|nr:hypothetical protein [Xanthomonadaceae bacterium]
MARPLSIFTDNAGTKLVSILIAVILWIVVLGSRTVEVTKEVPIEIVTNEDVMVSNELPDRVAFRISGPKAFIRTILDRRDPPIRINLQGAKPGAVTYRLFSDSLRVPIGVKVLSVNPNALVVNLEQMKSKILPVKIETRGVLPEGYKLVSIESVPATVKVRGAKTRIQMVAEIFTLPIDLTDLKQGFQKAIPLDTARASVELEGQPPEIKADIRPVSANFKVKNVTIRVLSHLKYRVREKTVTVLVRSSQEAIKLLDHSRVFAEIDLRDKAKGVYEIKPKVSLPGHIGFVSTQPETIGVTLF